MPRELALAGILFPTLLLVLLISVSLTWLLDGVLARVGFYRHVWRPPLFRLALFVCLFGAGGLLIYG